MRSAARHGDDASRGRTRLLVAAVTLLGLAVTGAAGAWVGAVQAHRAAEAERIASERAQAVVDRRINSYVAVLHGLSGLVTANDELTREQFRAYVAAARIHERYPGVQALQVTRAVDAADVAAFERSVRAEGFPDFAVHPASDAPTRYVVDYVEPLVGNEAAFGLDLSATPERLLTVVQARDRGETVASTGITLVQTGDRGFLLLEAIYEAGDVPTTVAERRASFRGLVNGVFRLDDVLADVLPPQIAGDVEIYDGGAVGERIAAHGQATLLYDSDDRLTAPRAVADPSDLEQVLVGGRRWLVFVDADGGGDAWLAPVVVACGLILTGALAALVASLARSRARAEVIAQRMTVDLAHRADELRDARDQARAADRAKSEFLSNMSHELRTPLNGILGTYELLDDDTIDAAARRRFLRLGQRSAQELLTIVNDVLDLSRIEAGHVELHPETIAVAGLIDDVTARMGVLAADKGVELTATIATGVPALVVGDPLRLRQVLVNLIANAIKFTDRGQVRVTVAPGDVTDHLHVAVADTGIGIADDDRDRIFRSFEQADPSTTRRYGGTGLGLSIVGRLVGLMDGRVWVDSAPGRGSTFHFTARLPTALATAPPPDHDGVPARAQ